VGKTTLLRQKSQKKNNIIIELQLNLQKHINICCFGFNKMSMNKKKRVARKV